MSNSGECGVYFRQQKELKRLFDEMRKKWQSYGRCAGTICLKNCSGEERKALERMLGQTFWETDVKITLNQVEKALQLAKAAADRDSYAAACLLAAYEKDKAGAAALLTDFRAVAAAGLRQSPHAPVQGIAAQRALRLAEAAIQRLGAQVNPKIVLSVFAAKFRAL